MDPDKRNNAGAGEAAGSVLPSPDNASIEPPPPPPRRGPVPPPPPPARKHRAGSPAAGHAPPDEPLVEDGLEDATGQFERPIPVEEDAFVAEHEEDDLASIIEFLTRELDSLGDEDRRQRAILLQECGMISEIVIGDEATAQRYYAEGQQVDPTFVPALRARARHQVRTESWEGYAETLRCEIDVTPGERDRAVLMTLLADVQWRRLDDDAAAIENLRAALALWPRGRRALDLLRSVCSRRSRWDDLLGVLRQLANVTSDVQERSRITSEMAEICEFRLKRTEQAEELYAQALEVDPSNEKALVALRRLYLAHRRWQRLSELLAKEAGEEHEPDEMYADLYRAARIAETHLHDDARAATLMETAAALRPSDPLPPRALMEIYQRTGRSEEFAAATHRQLRLARSPEVRAELCYRLGQVHRDWLGRPEKALEIFRQGLADKPDHGATVAALAEVYAQLECWEDLLDLELLRAERSADSNLRADGYARAAEISEQRCKDLPQAIDLYERAWRLCPTQTKAFRALDRLYRTGDQWGRLASLYEQRAQSTEDAALRMTLMRQTAEVHERRLHDPQRAIEVLEKLRQSFPDDRECLMQLARLYEVTANHESQCTALRRWAELTEDSGERIDLQRRVGEVLETQLQRQDAALDVYGDILSRVPEDRLTRQRLKAVLERAGHWERLVTAIEDEIACGVSPQEAALLGLQVGRIFEDKIGNLERAKEAYKKALESDPSCTPALVLLEDLLRREGAWEPMVALLDDRATHVRESGLGAAALCRAGEICEELLDDRERAASFYRNALDVAPSCEPARQGLERLYLAAEDLPALESHYLQDAEQTANAVLRVRAYLKLAALLESRGDAADAESAATAYESALRINERHPDAMHALASLCRRQGRWDRFGELLGQLAAATSDRDGAVASLKEWASIVEAHQSDQWDPAPIYERMLEADPADYQATSALDRLAHLRQDRQSLLRLALRQANATEDGTVAASLRMRAAYILVASEKYVEAAEVLGRALDAQPTHLSAVRLLRVVSAKLEQWDRVAALLCREGELCANRQERLTSLLRAGNILLDRFGSVADAKGVFEQVLVEDAHNVVAGERLAQILTRANQWVELAALYQRRMETLPATERSELQLRLAALYRDQLNDPAAAIQTLVDLVRVHPDDARALLQLADLCRSQKRWREAEQYLGRLAAVSVVDPNRQRQAYLDRAELLADPLGDEEQALKVIEEALIHHPGDREVLLRAVVIYRRRGDWERTVHLLKGLAKNGAATDRIDAFVELAEIYSRSLGDMERARAALSAAASICVQSGTGVDRVGAYFERRGDHEGYAACLGVALAALPPEGGVGEVTIRLARARVLKGRLLRPDEAETEITKALQSDPGSVDARLELAALHLWGDHLDQAAQQYIEVLKVDFTSVEGYRGLFRVYERRGNLDSAATAAQAVCALGEPNEPEGKLAEQASAAFSSALSAAANTPLGLDGYRALLCVSEEPPAATTLLHAIGDYLPAVCSGELEPAMGEPLIPLEAHDPLLDRCLILSRILGVERLQCAMASEVAGKVDARPGAVPTLVIEQGLTEQVPDAEFRFLVGRALAETFSRSLYLRLLSPRTLEIALAAVAELFERGFGDYLALAEELEAMTRQMGRAIPRKVRKTLEPAARAYVAEGPFSPVRAQIAARRSAERTGLLLAGDVRAALGALRREGAESRALANLLRFSVDARYHQVRERLGLAV